jgi:AAA+ ATPase superfamily predicted ATPase
MCAELVGRRKELLILENQFRSEGSSLVAVTGRRHAGKTALLAYFASRHPNTLYFPVREEPAARNLMYFRRAVGRFLNDPSAVADADWNRSFRALVGGRRSQKVVIIMDEFVRIGRKDPSFPSVIRYIWDTVLRSSRVMLVLSGSSLPAMEDQVTGYGAPLFGVMTASVQVGPLSYHYCGELAGPSHYNDLLHLYAAAGGTPLALRTLASHKDVMKGISEELLDPGGAMREVAEATLREEFSDPAVYESILVSIATGHRRLQEISEDLGMPQTGLTSYLSNLAAAGLVEREVPLPGGGKKGRYSLADPLADLWFGVVVPDLELLERGPVSALEAEVSEHLEKVSVPRAYRRACIERLWELSSSGAWDFAFTEAGGWWDRETEVEAAGFDASGMNLVAADCGYNADKEKGIESLEDLRRSAAKMARQLRAEDTYYVIFSASGFTEELMKTAENDPKVLLEDLS